MKTYGYDYSFGISVDEVNKILISNLQNVNLELKYSGIDKESGSTITIDAKMKPWQIVTDGSQNKLLRFSMPLSDGYMAVEGKFLSKSYDLTNVTMIVEVTLSWLDAGGNSGSEGTGEYTNLVFSPTQSDEPDNDGYVAIVKVLDPDKRLDTIGLGILKSYTADILIENRETVNYIFASVFPTIEGKGSWLTPYKWIYYYCVGKSYDALCFLCLIQDTAWPSNPAFDSKTLTSANNTTILISQEAFFNHTVLSSVKETFTDGTFSMSVDDNENCKITNSGDFSVKTDKGDITASSYKLTPSNAGDGLTSLASGGGPLKFLFGLVKLPGASYSWSCQDTNQAAFKNNMIVFEADLNPIEKHDQTIHWYDWVILIAAGITSLPGLISLIVDSINDFSDRVNDIGLTNINSGLSNAMGGSVLNMAKIVNWNEGGKKFSVSEAGLDGAIYVYGNLK